MGKNNPETLRKWRERNREHLRQYEKDRYQRIREEKLAYERERHPAYYAANKERIKAKRMERYYADREKALEVNRRWREQNRDAYMANHRKQQATRRARKKNAFVEGVDPKVVLERSSGICGICGDPIEGDFHVDHIVPLARGGEHSYANTQAAHPRCNWDKGDKL